MSLAFFIYTLVLLVVCVVAGAVCISAYLVSHRRSLLYAAGVFLFYLFDVAFIFQNEFLAQNLSFDSALYYHIHYPYLKVAVSAGFLACLWLIVCDYLGEQRRAMLVAPVATYAVMCVLVIMLVGEGPAQQFLYYSMRQLLLAFMAAYVAWRYLHATDEVERLRMGRFRLPYAAFCAIVLCTLAEDFTVIVILPPDTFTPDFPLYLSERNFSENVFLVLLAWMALREASDTLALRFERPPQREDQPIQKHIDDLLPAYCKKHGLSSREAEVLRLVLMGKDNQNIASELTLALGTVKAHVHNILKKTGQPDRESLKRDFWSD